MNDTNVKVKVSQEKTGPVILIVLMMMMTMIDCHKRLAFG